MRNIKVTPPGAPVLGIGSTRTIIYPPLEQFVLVDAEMARASGPDALAGMNLGDAIKAYDNGQTVNFIDGPDFSLRNGVAQGVMVTSVSPGVIDRIAARLDDPSALREVLQPVIAVGQPAYGKFSGTHRTRPNHLSPPAGIFGDEEFMETHAQAAVREFREEFVIVSGDQVGQIMMYGYPDDAVRARDYAISHNMKYNPNLIGYAFPTTSNLHSTIVFGLVTYQVLSEWEPETSSNEIISTCALIMPEEATIVDGERFPDGQWRNEPVIVGFDASHNDEMPMTTKAQIFDAAFRSGFRVNI